MLGMRHPRGQLSSPAAPGRSQPTVSNPRRRNRSQRIKGPPKRPGPVFSPIDLQLSTAFALEHAGRHELCLAPSRAADNATLHARLAAARPAGASEPRAGEVGGVSHTDRLRNSRGMAEGLCLGGAEEARGEDVKPTRLPKADRGPVPTHLPIVRASTVSRGISRPARAG